MNNQQLQKVGKTLAGHYTQTQLLFLYNEMVRSYIRSDDYQRLSPRMQANQTVLMLRIGEMIGAVVPFLGE